MRVRSFFQLGSELQILDVELTLVAGLPQIVFIGLPDRALKESALRIKAAIRAQGFKFPIAQRVLVHLKPSHLLKKSCGLDLAVAAALLWETRQIPQPADMAPLLYGELSLRGEIERPSDLAGINSDSPVWTGVGGPLSVPVLEFRNLKDLLHQTPVLKRLPILATRPTCPVASFDSASAEVAMIVAAGEHSALVTGPPGAGKSTLVESIPSWLEAPCVKSLTEFKKETGAAWRPVSRPHHSSSSLSIIGGGAQIWAGEIAKVNNGVLIMDELLEFKSDVQEALREPMDTGSISIMRAGRTKVFPARVLVLATTNLCPCGKFIPGPQTRSRCICRAVDRRRSLARLTGPFADRFSILYYLESFNRNAAQVSATEIGERVAAAIEFRRDRGQLVANESANTEQLSSSLSEFQKDDLLGGVPFASRRRLSAVIRVARTVADLEASLELRDRHVTRALELCFRNHRLLEQSND